MSVIARFGLWSTVPDKWFATRQAAKLFFLATLLVVTLTFAQLAWARPARMSTWQRIPWAVLGVAGGLAALYLWSGMCRYWVRVDDSRRIVKRIWFPVVLFGLWYGGCLYYYCVYLPQVRRKWKTGS